jgi:hypothetical protein
MGAAQDGAPRPPKQAAKAPEPTFQFLVDRVRECMQEGILREEDPTQVAAVIWAFVHGLVSLRLSGHLEPAGSDAEFARFYERAAERLVAGLAP